jgi:hypothetical protein
MAKAKLTREQWLNKVADKAAVELFKPAGYEVPKNIRYTVGFPSKAALARRNQRIGECWSAGASEDNVFEISVSPVISEGVRAADILVHEMIHATVGLAAGHKAPFVKCARAVGLEGKPTATYAGTELKSKLEAIIKAVGQYPHAGLRAAAASRGPGKGMVKVECADCCAEGERYVVRMGEYSLKRGMPLCPVHNKEMVCA